MRVRTVILLVGSLLVVVFAGANWAQFTQPVTLDLIFQQYEAPFGLAMLGVLVAFVALFLVSMGGVEIGALRKTLAASREIEAARKVVADKEAGRIGHLETLIRERFGAVDQKLERIVRQLDSQDRRGLGEADVNKDVTHAGTRA